LIIVFDLDDTLYDEVTFVKSGLKAVSDYLYIKYSISKTESMNFFNNELSKGREKILDKILKEYDIFSKNEVKKCLSIYRSHNPKIQLYPQAKRILQEFNRNSIYILTDGNKMVQKKKIFALGIQKKVKKFILTSNYGIKNSKPSPYCFMKICEIENIKPSELIYIGDNPNKDFVGIKPFEFKTIRILSGRYKNIKKNKKFEADITLNSLKELTKKLIINIMK